jgi:predicted O-methyltransferase YrrM
MRAFNDMVAADPRVDAALLTIGDGLTMLRKR